MIVTIALGIGANTAIFSVINGFLRPLPVPRPEQIVFIAASTKGDETGFRYRFSFPVVEDLRRQATSFSEVFGFGTELAGITVDGKTSEFLYSSFTGDAFAALGVKPVAGRLFRRGEGESTSAELLVVLGYAYWQKHFGGSPSVVDRQIRLEGRSARIIGVAPKGFHGMYGGADMDGYTTLSGTYHAQSDAQLGDRSWSFLTVMGRLKPGVSLAEAQSAVNVLARRFEEQYPESNKGIGIRLIPETRGRPLPLRFIADAVPMVRGLLLTLSGLVLMLACMNVANLIMVRAAMRGREMAIRAALGSGRARLVRQMLTESGLLAIFGAAGGLVFAKWGSDLFAGSIHIATDFPVLLDFSFDWRVFLYALAASVATGVGIGLWPALRASRADGNSVLHDGGRSDAAGAGHPSRQRLRRMLVTAQVAGSLVLLIVAGLFVRSLREAQRMDLGFDPDHLVNVRLNPHYLGYDQPRTEHFYRELKRRVTAMPGVQSATLAFTVPVGYISDADQVLVEGRPRTAGEQLPLVGSNRVDEDYFTTMRIAIVQGRGFRESDTEGAKRVAVVNQTMAERYWPGQDPIGKRFRLSEDASPVWEVVGVARDSKYLAVFEGPLPYFYFPIAQRYLSVRELQVRSAMPTEMVRLQIQRAIQSLDQDMPASDLQSMRDALEGGPGGMLLFRLGARQGAFMGLLGLVLAMIGVYGVVSCGAAQRTHEIGIRMAIGAQPGDILRMIFRQGVILVAAGVGAGVISAAVLTRLAGHWLLIASQIDPLIYGGIALALGGIALGACYIPARRAMRVDPLVALRHE